MVTGAIATALLSTPGALDPAIIRDAVDESGDNIDARNPMYRGKIGTRLNMRRLVLLIRLP